MAGIMLDEITARPSKDRLVAGIDEAGRGSLVGDLYVALVVIDPESLALLEDLGVRDSKELSPPERERLYRSIVEAAGCIAVAMIPPSLIDERNLNTLEYKAMERLVAWALSRRCVPERIVVDLVGNPSKLKHYLRRAGYRGEIIAVEKADATYTEASAASIVAKVLRDRALRRLAEVYGDMGSGYPGDPRLREWLSKKCREGGLPPIVRRSWKTLLEYCPEMYREKKTGQRTLEEYME